MASVPSDRPGPNSHETQQPEHEWSSLLQQVAAMRYADHHESDADAAKG
jgi:hypothetical protein